LAFKIIAILHNTRLATFINLLETVSTGLFRNRSQNSCQTLLLRHRVPPHLVMYSMITVINSVQHDVAEKKTVVQPLKEFLALYGTR
jgi:hypothetical protein